MTDSEDRISRFDAIQALHCSGHASMCNACISSEVAILALPAAQPATGPPVTSQAVVNAVASEKVTAAMLALSDAIAEAVSPSIVEAQAELLASQNRLPLKGREELIELLGEVIDANRADGELAGMLADAILSRGNRAVMGVGSQPDFAAITLEKGAHVSRDEGVCAMELVAWMAGEEHSDSPACVSPVLGAFLRRWNDDLDDAGRQRLKPFLARVIGTAGDGHDERRGWLLTDWMVRTHLPAWLDLAGITQPAASLRALPEIADPCSLTACTAVLEDARSKAAAARATAAATALDAALAAALDAASAAAWGAAWAAALAAARATAWAAALAAALAAARDAARAAARDAAATRLEPTKISLQESAFALLDRLINPVRP